MRFAWLVALLLLLSGCSADLETEERSLRVSEHSQGLRGVNVTVEFQWHRHADQQVEVHAITSARNEGAATYRTETQCGSPWRYWFEREAQRFEHRAPVVSCEAFITEPFPAGKRLGSRLDWQRTEWNATNEKTERAPEGTYSLFVAFSFYGQDQRMDSVVLSYPFELPP